MPNTGKALTNAAFRAKILALIDKLKDQDKTALVRHVDDFEALNKDTFEAAMNALVEAIPEGGGGGGGGGDSVYTVTFGVNFEATSDHDLITCDKTVADIISHAGEHIVGRFVLENYPMEEVPITINIYCDNLRFDYQQLNSDDPEVAPMLPAYTYLGFCGDSLVLSAINSGTPLSNDPIGDDDLHYYTGYISFCYLFADEEPCWKMTFDDIGGGGGSSDPIQISNILFENDPTLSFNNNWTLSVESKTGTGNAALYIHSSVLRGEGSFLKAFMPLEWSADRKTALYSPTLNGANGTQFRIYQKAAQAEIYVNLSGVSGTSFNGIFNIGNFTWYSEDSYGRPEHGKVEMFMDEDDASNNKIIRHIIVIEIYFDGANYIPRSTYKQVEIPYTIHSY